MRLVRQPQVIHDLVEIASFIAQDNLETSDRFLLAVEETFQQLLVMPGIGRATALKNPALSDIKVWRVKGFENYLVFYKAIATEVTIIRVIHGARDLEALFEE